MGQYPKMSFELSGEMRKQLFSVESLQDYIEKNEGSSRYPHADRHAGILWIKKGVGKFYLDMEVFELEANTLYFIRPGQIHKLECDLSAGGYILVLSKPPAARPISDLESVSYNEMMLLMEDINKIVIDENMAPDMHDIFERMMKETISNREY